MLSIPQAFTKFKNRLELSGTEQADAASRQQRIRTVMDDAFDVKHDFLTGSYSRHTKTKPLHDVDIFVQLGDAEAHYQDKHPDSILTSVRTALATEYGEQRVALQRRSVRVDFGVKLVDDLTDAVMSFDVTPAFGNGGHYLIPDRTTGDWMPTDPQVHATKATAANAAFGGHWKPVVKMIKKWNEHHDKPIKPSFLIEVMSLEIVADWGGSYPRELKAWFATAIDAIDQTWDDPAGLGHPVSDRMNADAGQLATARLALKQAEAACTSALNHDRAGHTGAALDVWQQLFGTAFAKS
ncbi:CBASS oligonucleotide cyclase [Candidatus Poriferisodalis sp.]|uniref:CBASS oligonucleotide cyclase n=1 Tax=Candidatus Poriferisodalis sp. TaxID=3101277 RepID=UPI003C6EB086